MVDLRQQEAGYSVLRKLQSIQHYPSYPLHPEAASWFAGYLGERAVGAALEPLKAQGYTILHGVPFLSGEGDIDHLVITPSGWVYSLNTKRHFLKRVVVSDNAVWVEGHPQQHDPIAALQNENRKVRLHLTWAQLDVKGVSSLLVYVDAKSFANTAAGPLFAIELSHLIQHIREEEYQRRGHFDASELCDSSVWKKDYDPRHLAQQTERLAWFQSLHDSGPYSVAEVAERATPSTTRSPQPTRAPYRASVRSAYRPPRQAEPVQRYGPPRRPYSASNRRYRRPTRKVDTRSQGRIVFETFLAFGFIIMALFTILNGTAFFSH